MPSDVVICNLALAHLGDRATVASIDPPEGSAQAEHCAQFYPIARDALLELYDWTFTIRRQTLAQVASPYSQWAYAYLAPAECIRVLAVLPADGGLGPALTSFPPDLEFDWQWPDSQALQQQWDLETDANGNRIIYSNLPQAIVKYKVVANDPTKFSPLFVLALSYHLAAMLAGPLLKGDAGAAMALRMAAMAEKVAKPAAVSDLNQQRKSTGFVPSSIAARC